MGYDPDWRGPDMLSHVKYFKTPSEIKKAIDGRIKWLTDKAETRNQRIKDIRTKFNIDDPTLASIMVARANDSHRSHYSNSNSAFAGGPSGKEGTVIPAGEVENICVEMEYLEKESKEYETLVLMVKHMDMKAERYEVNLSDLRQFEF